MFEMTMADAVINDNADMSVLEVVARALAKHADDDFEASADFWFGYAIAALLAQRKVAETMKPLIYRTAMLTFLDSL